MPVNWWIVIIHLLPTRGELAIVVVVAIVIVVVVVVVIVVVIVIVIVIVIPWARHPGERRGPEPVHNPQSKYWIPAFAGMTLQGARWNDDC
ncbi:hypothetical protein [Desulfatirhabdium butyrativorans]|uniref:hypothetical protein n=1 Tax=Desulfatirhabdium butyrativorans TaxID=340467 RepID=UPI00055427D5|nr:hypothetical protein [Desulfatirhabdium butyrativorans]